LLWDDQETGTFVILALTTFYRSHPILQNTTQKNAILVKA